MCSNYKRNFILIFFRDSFLHPSLSLTCDYSTILWFKITLHFQSHHPTCCKDLIFAFLVNFNKFYYYDDVMTPCIKYQQWNSYHLTISIFRIHSFITITTTKRMDTWPVSWYKKVKLQNYYKYNRYKMSQNCM